MSNREPTHSYRPLVRLRLCEPRPLGAVHRKALAQLAQAPDGVMLFELPTERCADDLYKWRLAEIVRGYAHPRLRLTDAGRRALEEMGEAGEPPSQTRAKSRLPRSETWRISTARGDDKR
jgi:hypothetical protein